MLIGKTGRGCFHNARPGTRGCRTSKVGTSRGRASKTAATPVAKPAAVPATGTPSGANQFPPEGAARLRCSTDTVVWANLGTKVYHFSGNKDYGNTKKGAYVCEKDTAAEGFRAAKNEKHP